MIWSRSKTWWSPDRQRRLSWFSKHRTCIYKCKTDLVRGTPLKPRETSLTVWRSPGFWSRSDHRQRGRFSSLIQCNINYTELRTTFELDRKTPNKPYFIDFAVYYAFSEIVLEPKTRNFCILFTLGLYDYSKIDRLFASLCTSDHLVG